VKSLRSSLHSLSVARAFTPQLSEHKRSLFLVGGASLCTVAFELLRPWPIGFLFDNALAPKGEPRFDFATVVWGSALASLLVAAARAGMEYFGTLRQAEVGHAVTRSLRKRIFEHLTELPIAFHSRHKAGDLMMRLMGDVPMLRTMIVDSAMALASRAVLVVGMLVVMLAMDLWLTLAVFAVIPTVFLVVRIISRRITSAVRKQRRKEGDMADYLHEAVAGVAVLQSLGRGPDAVRKFARSNRSSARAGLKAKRLAARLSFSVETLLAAAVAGTLFLGSWRVFDGAGDPDGFTAGNLIIFLSYVRGLLKPVRAASRHGEKIAKGTACGERILTVLNERVTIVSAVDAEPAPEHPQRLRFDGVAFQYGEDDPVLEGLDVTFERGQLTGLFGRSGAGKSTMAALVLRLADPVAGAVRLDDMDIAQMELTSLRSRFGLCLQETMLFGESVRDNLLLGDPEADDEALWAALDEAAASEVVESLPEGLDHVLGATGSGLSGGQRRRLSLARTLLRNPPVLIVDEPFSGLDRPAVRRVRDSLSRRAEQGLVIVICHEVEHLPACDRVVFLDQGKVRDSGSHDELMERCDDYATLVNGPSVAGVL